MRYICKVTLRDQIQMGMYSDKEVTIEVPAISADQAEQKARMLYNTSSGAYVAYVTVKQA